MPLPDRYQISGAALAGGMGSVHPCQDAVLERKVAIKVIRDTANRRRMLDELKALLKMRSKHVVQVYDVLQLSGSDLGIVQEFIEGSDLFDDALAPTTTTAFYKQLWQIASGISDIHAVGVIHRDIKLNNMKLDPEGVVKIFDFGLARDDGPAASTVGFVGTRGFAAPELYLANAKFTVAVDTYAFGASALFLAMRGLPGDLMAQPPTPTAANYFTGLPFAVAPEIIQVLDQCLVAKPQDRPAMSHVRDLLARHVLFDRHQALLVFQGRALHLNAGSRSVNLSLPNMGQIQIRYDGLDFRVQSLGGDVLVNNRQLNVGDGLPGSCVIALGAQDQGNRRRYITFDLSHPEIVL
ncbi:serine/threonine protein kinase [Acidovorax sp. D2M1]|uniref:Serine/threonine protein kinase n=1 Tax=Acidovorax benzenivorans TaxID=2987520 RepID=A0ABT5S1Y6_9BURK|nr:serine/threonine-protein kinase [Acidovorax benzenivorans]MDD2179968.1 serine/threonine protein kinase [Acidovorax benzenivorans]